MNVNKLMSKSELARLGVDWNGTGTEFVSDPAAIGWWR